MSRGFSFALTSPATKYFDSDLVSSAMVAAGEKSTLSLNSPDKVFHGKRSGVPAVSCAVFSFPSSKVLSQSALSCVLPYTCEASMKDVTKLEYSRGFPTASPVPGTCSLRERNIHEFWLKNSSSAGMFNN